MTSKNKFEFDQWLENILNPKKEKDIHSDWISLTNYPLFEISATIPYVIRAKGSNKLISQSRNNVGYYQINLNGKTLLIHRIIAKQFIPNPNNYSDVNHKNHDKLDNRIENLEWLPHEKNLEQRKKYNKQKSEFVEDIDLSNCVKIKSFDYNNLDRYYYDKVNAKIYLKRKSNKKYKVVNPTNNGNMLIVSLVNSEGKTFTRSYKKLMNYLEKNY